ncbi:MAG: mechanosensitive ion channel domain-containing protein [Leptodesmis sp.]|uniref:mechanosensitive ion channel domain-containing protein n=1 Tax=Leptodesmis sp. TaxID=3100501 RepID=UPI003D0D9AA0
MGEGTVEAIEPRTTHIRHPDGQLQIICNGEIGSIVNYSKHYSYEMTAMQSISTSTSLGRRATSTQARAGAVSSAK